MQRSRFSLALSACLAVVIAVPTLVLGIVRDIGLAFAVMCDPRAVDRFFRELDLDLAGVPNPAATPVDPATENDLRHEAGLARLAAVRHC